MTATTLSPLRHLDLSEINTAAQKETRRREAFLPPVSVFRWWARRTDAVNGLVIEATARDVGRSMLIADPFAGGGVIPLAGVVRGHRVYAQDLDPWAAAGIHTMLTLPDADQLMAGASDLYDRVADLLDSAYATEMSSGHEARVTQTLRVATTPCPACGTVLRLFPHAFVTRTRRRELPGSQAYLACPRGHLFVGDHEARRSTCPDCSANVDPAAAYTAKRRFECWSCGTRSGHAQTSSAWSWQVVLVQRAEGRDRELSPPTAAETSQAEFGWEPQRSLGCIPDGVETRVLLRHGFRHWEDLYPRRQRVVTEALLGAIDALEAEDSHRASVVRALRQAVLGTAEMAGLLSRWDRWYLKSYEAMARHRFSVTTLAAEPNVWGVGAHGRGTALQRIRSTARAVRWFEDQAEFDRSSIAPPIAASSRRSPMGASPVARIVVGPSQRIVLPDACVDLVLTDPPYHNDIHYSELAAVLRAWAGLPSPGAGSAVVTGANAISRYSVLLGEVFCEVRRTLRPEGHLVLSFANRDPKAWIALFEALQSAGFRGVGYAIVHGENETDYAKRINGNYRHNLLVDVVDSVTQKVTRWRPRLDSSDSEIAFLMAAGETALMVGRLKGGWRERLVEKFDSSGFLS